jgi:hypothetical protein
MSAEQREELRQCFERFMHMNWPNCSQSDYDKCYEIWRQAINAAAQDGPAPARSGEACGNALVKPSCAAAPNEPVAPLPSAYDSFIAGYSWSVDKQLGCLHDAKIAAKEWAERASPQAVPALSEREAFEAAMRMHGYSDAQTHWTFEDDGCGGYHNEATDTAWIAWQARAALSQDEAGPTA